MSALGYNTGYIEELYNQYLQDPSSVSESWQDFFADYQPARSFVPSPDVRQSARAMEKTVVKLGGTGDGANTEVTKRIDPVPEVDVPSGVTLKDLRGAAARIVENMEESLQVPTATSVREIPVRLLAENRSLINEYQRYYGGFKVSFTHLVGWAVIKGLMVQSNMFTSLKHAEGGPKHVIPDAINFGLAIDIERRGKRTLMVPNIKDAGNLNFAQFLGAYNDIVIRARDGKITPEDFSGTNATLTNPGMIGTVLSVPRLMAGQGVIIGVGAIGYPPEYQAIPKNKLNQMGISQVMTITSTYDHRVIQGAESGAFLAYISELLQGKHGFYKAIFSDLGIPYQPYSNATDTTPPLIANGDLGASWENARKQASVMQFIRATRVRAHLQADVNPLGYTWEHHPELDPSTYGLNMWDLDRKFVTGDLGGADVLPLREVLAILRQTYMRKIGIEYMHISDPMEKRWLQERIEPVRGADPLTPDMKRRILQRLNNAEAFERFLHTKYIGHKRFSLEGAETLIPMIDALLSDAADQEVKEVVIGMAHRGRLNVLANILNKPYEVIFSEFEGSLDPNTTQGSGDVKYHLGAKAEHESPSGSRIRIELASNPSHLEAVNPVVEGMVRAKQDIYTSSKADAPGGDYKDAVIPLLVHGDAAFAGQGVVAETLNLSQLEGYTTGGTIHIVVNNQIGFTTSSDDARSSTYATDVARMIQAPIFHVNGDDPESCIRVIRLALDFRQVFNKDVVIDLLCYRVHGHNEGDEPTYTQPLLYKKIESKRSVRKLYTELLLRRGEMEPDEAEKMLDEYRAILQEAFDRVKALQEKEMDMTVFHQPVEKEEDRDVATSVSKGDLDAIAHALTRLPEGFNKHEKLSRQYERRMNQYLQGEKIDWAFGEALAFGTLLMEGTRVRLAGQDSRRGTFSHRHAVLYDQVSGEEYIPLNHIQEEQETLLVYDSLLSEYAACGFEFGYSVSNDSALVLWEAQFGDFANGAQIIFDQFLSASFEKWSQRNRLVLLLPHGYEGQGPEHSSARLERFLQLCAEGNMSVCNITTPANLFHVLRRQVKRENGRPLVIMAPKSLLRLPQVISTPDAFTSGTFDRIISASIEPESARKLVLCSGKVYYDLLAHREKNEAFQQTAIARVEQFYPFPLKELKAELERYKNVSEVCWAQEEPANMGAWSFMRYRLDDILEAIHDNCENRVTYAGRKASASTAVGSAKKHAIEQIDLLTKALQVSAG